MNQFIDFVDNRFVAKSQDCYATQGFTVMKRRCAYAEDDRFYQKNESLQGNKKAKGTGH
ncbi:hypothetical protein [Shewanella sp. P1-14-1]|uniref:hypothetical protein n=1 Tax=Shewanella sp. P1-14-1 TaxID=1723761 RepID=UPI000A42AA47|nr:hypothetical protein [Shewanella sp. P1-14-1]